VGNGVDCIGIRPEHLTLAEDGGLRGSVIAAEHMGSDTFAHVDCGGERPVVVRLSGAVPVKAGEHVGLRAAAAHLHLFDAAGGALRRAAASMSGAA
jgi:ABC-type sugar transport system ATPase subunit